MSILTYLLEDEEDDEHFAPPTSTSGAPTATNQKSAPRFGYLRAGIAAARFGSDKRAALLRAAYSLQEQINKTIVGQKEAASALQNRLVSYLESHGTRTREPMAIHLAGDTGVGKTGMIDELEKMGITVLRFDAQHYVGNKKSLANDMRDAVRKLGDGNEPYVIAIEEMDKMAEIVDGRVKTNAFIGTVNQILSDGTVSDSANPRKSVNVSNALVVTTMNFSPTDFQAFTREVLKKKKSYYDFSDEDFAAFDGWLRAQNASRYKVLSRIFRSNTVGRLASNLVMMSSLQLSSYSAISRRMIEAVIARTRIGAPVEKHLTVDFSPAYADFITKTTKFTPSGARETVHRSDLLTEQLVQYGTRATFPGDRSLDRPRKIFIDFDPSNARALLTITPRLLTGRAWHEGRSFSLDVDFDPILGEFRQPAEGRLALGAPAQTSAGEGRPARILKKDVMAARFPKHVSRAKGLAKAIGKTIFGNAETAQLLEREFTAYLGRPGPAEISPTTLVLAGYPGLGKSAMVLAAAKYLKLPVVRVNMEQFMSDESASVKDFLDTIDIQLDRIADEKGDDWDGKYVLLLEELDKVNELQKGERVNHPVISAVKDLLNNGLASRGSLDPDMGTMARSVDVRPAFVIVTMNFPMESFDFRADPRFTTIKDTFEVWKRLKSRLADMRDLLGSMFRPETVNRLISHLHILEPLKKSEYDRLIESQLALFVKERFVNEDGLNPSQISVKLTPAYRRYLFAETVVPSEGPRYTSKNTRNKIAADTEEAVRKLRRSADYASEPVTIVLDYHPGRTQVVAKVAAKDAPAELLYKRKVALFFPPLAARGRMTARRIKTAVHEFGHAYVAVRLGLRIENVSVIPPSEDMGGYVRFRDNDTARAMMARVYSAVASRALERMFLSADPMAKESVMDVTRGPTEDIRNATENLFDMIHSLGFNPDGGTIDRTGGFGMDKYANFADIPPDVAEKLGLVLRDMEDYIVKDLTRANPRAWYIAKISELARRGGVNEKEFYDLLGYRHPGAKLEKQTLGERSRLHDSFGEILKPEPAGIRAARAFRQGTAGTTAAENLDAYTARFLRSLRERLGPPAAATAASMQGETAARP